MALFRRRREARQTGAASGAGGGSGRSATLPAHARTRNGEDGAARIPREVAARIRLVVLDVDGVLTDAGVYLGEDGEGRAIELKRFDIQDGLGVKLLGAAGIEVAIVSGRASNATSVRARELGIAECHQEPGARKLPVVDEIRQRQEIEWDAVAMLGDDLPDIPVFRRVGLAVAVGNAVAEVRREAAWTTRRDGGRGAVREFARVLLEARGEWKEQVDAYVDARSGLDGDGIEGAMDD